MADDYFYFLVNKFVNDLQEAVEALQEFPLHNDLKEIRDMLQEKTRFDTSLIRELKPRLFDLNEMLADCVMIQEQRRQIKSAVLPSRSAKELWNVMRARQKLMGIKKELEICRGKADESEISSSILVLKPEAFHYYNEFEIHGFQKQEQDIENRLLIHNEDRKAIAIVGMGGSGKTTLARSVFHSPNVRSHFKLRLWIDLSEATDAEKKYFCIFVEKFGCGYIKSPCKYGLGEVLSTLYGFIGESRCLIVLDGVWHGNKGIQDFIDVILRDLDGAVIVTSRFLDVAKFLVAEHGYLHHIQPLDPQDCWAIFLNTIRKKNITASSHPAFEQMEEVAYSCDGLPLAVKTVAEIWFIQNIRNWTSAWQFATNSSKRMLFEINVHDRVSLSKAWYKVIGLQDVKPERTLYYKNRFLVTATCDPEDIALELWKFGHVELISVDPDPV